MKTLSVILIVLLLASCSPSVPPGKPGIGTAEISPKDGMVLLYVPAGSFKMGSTDADPEAQANEKPQHSVILDAFWIDKTEVTNAMYAKCLRAGACNQPTSLGSNTQLSYFGNSKFDNYPVIYVTWNMAKAYCEWAGRQLPTEAQWEKAARGTDGRLYPWGNDAPDNNLLNYNQKGGVGDPIEVGKFPKGASVYGALDMAGNVLEWVNDWYTPTYYQSSPSTNPLGPDSGDTRVLRGGSWGSTSSQVLSARRWEIDPTHSINDVGFRCSRSP